MHSRPLGLVALIALWAFALPVSAQDTKDLPLVYQEDFEKGAANWEPTDPNNWRIEETPMGKVYAQVAKQSKYEPPHRSPFNIALLKDVVVGDFVLEAKLKSTIPDYGHRDMCLF